MKTRIFDFRFSIFDWTGYWRVLCVLMSFFFLMGCPPPKRMQEPLCPGKASVQDALGTLRQKQTPALSIQAAIHCVMEITNPQGKPERPDFNGKMVFAGPDNLRIGGSTIAGSIVIGTNEKEFWLYIKPLLDAARWGEKKNITPCVAKLGFNPFHVGEALGQIDLDRDWTLKHTSGFDILTTPDGQGIKSVYINCCTYQIERIEYSDMFGNLVSSADLSDYRDVSEAGSIPQSIELRYFRSGKVDSTAKLRLSGISFFEPLAAKKNLFQRPVPRGYKSVYRLTENCEFVLE